MRTGSGGFVRWRSLAMSATSPPIRTRAWRSWRGGRRSSTAPRAGRVWVLLRSRLAGQQALIDASTAAAGDAGAPYDQDYVVDVVTDACAFARARAGPDG